MSAFDGAPADDSQVTAPLGTDRHFIDNQIDHYQPGGWTSISAGLLIN